MNVLLVAYACEPNKGSEPLVGWRWALEIVRKGHLVWVVTRSNNRAVIEAYEKKHGSTGINFEYCDLPAPFPTLKKRVPGGVYAYYYFWQFVAYFTARRLVRTVNFDWVHQLTFVTVRFPTFISLLGVSSIVGPLGGGERSPVHLRSSLGLKFWLSEWLRSIALWLHRLDPFRALGLTFATRIYCTTNDSIQTLPWWVRGRARVLSAIACDGEADSLNQKPSKDRINLLYAGLHKDWKGLRLGLRALKLAVEQHQSSFHLSIVGRGPDHRLWRGEVDRLGLASNVEFIDWLPRDELLSLYGEKDAFLFPSLHDSGGFVVLEAMARGLPVICLKCGGPGVSMTKDTGHCQEVLGLTTEQIIEGLAAGILALTDPDQRRYWSEGARVRARQLTWSRLVAQVYPDDPSGDRTDR